MYALSFTCDREPDKSSILTKPRINSPNVNIETTELNLSNNPAYETRLQLHKNVVYEDSTLHTGELQLSSELLSTTEHNYSYIILPATNQIHDKQRKEEDSQLIFASDWKSNRQRTVIYIVWLWIDVWH